MTAIPAIICEQCGAVAPRRGATQRYCEPCSEARDLKRKRLWARSHPPDAAMKKAKAEAAAARTERARDAGAAANAEAAMSIAWDGRAGPELIWTVRVAVPFSYAASKNHIYTGRRGGHVALRRESATFRDCLAKAIRDAVGGQKVAHNKVWIDALVQKPNHKGDAVNLVDLICDAVKIALPVDDRWFCIRRLDWEIVRASPRLFVGVGQESDEDSQVCSYCGQIKPFAAFNCDKCTKLGIGRECRECRRVGRKLATNSE